MTSQISSIDCRSDTVTKPCIEMRKAMAEAIVGDDVFGDDPTVKRLEQVMAKLLCKEAGLFVPTGTMGNLISVMTHCWGRGLEIIVGDKSHIHLYEQGNIAQFAGVHHRTVKNKPNGTFCLDEMKSLVRYGAPLDPHLPITSLVCIENSHNKCGGRTLPLEWIENLGQACKELELPIHCDGARLFNSAVALKVPVADLVQHCDSVSICLSKGLGCPIGSVIVGSKDFIAKAVRVRKTLGGGMRQVGILAAAGLYAIQHNIERLSVDHNNAKKVMNVIRQYGNGILTVDETSVDTNLVFAKLDTNVINAEHLVQRLEKVSEEPDDSVSVRTLDFATDLVRISFHLDVTEEMTDLMCKKLVFVLNELSQQQG